MKDWAAMQTKISSLAKDYLASPEQYVRGSILSMGYKTCHHLKKSLNASRCADDCKKMEREKFATNCHLTGGLFKCCIRRDAAFCNECRWTIYS